MRLFQIVIQYAAFNIMSAAALNRQRFLRRAGMNDEVTIESSSKSQLPELRLTAEGLDKATKPTRRLKTSRRTNHSTAVSASAFVRTAFEIVASQGDLSWLVVLASEAAVDGILAGNGPLTVLAPVNTAFFALEPTFLARLLEPEWMNHLSQVLLLHVSSADTIMSTDLTNGMVFATPFEDLTVNLTSGVAFVGPVNSARVVQADLSASNGVVHKVDTVLLPAALSQSIFQVASSNLLLSTLTGLIVTAGLEATLTRSDLTVLAPTNAAFTALPHETLQAVSEDLDLLRHVLLYHVLPGLFPTQLLQDGQLVDTALPQETIAVSISGNAVSFGNVPVTRENFVAANGLLHMISGVLIPPAGEEATSAPVTPSPTLAPVSTPTAAALRSVLEVVAVQSDLSRLVVAATTAAIDDLLLGNGPLTLLAPMNAAFNALDPTLLARLLEPEWMNHLSQVLLLHVSSADTIMSTDLTNGMIFATPFEDLTVNLTSGVAFVGPVNSARVVQADLSASNGVVHKVDTVLLPAALSQSIFQVASSNLLLSTLTGLIVTAGLEATLTRSDLTVLAPTNAAFTALPHETLQAVSEDLDLLRHVLLYHVLPGLFPTQLLQDGQLVDTALPQETIAVSISGNAVSFGNVPVTRENFVAANGLLHMISGVLIPPAGEEATSAPVTPSPTLAPVSTPTAAALRSVLEVVAVQSDLSRLVVAATTAAIDDLLLGNGPLTLLAPMNAAFNALDPTLLARLLEPEWMNHLSQVLLLHVSSADTIMSTDLTNGMIFATPFEDLTVNLTSGVAFVGPVNSARVVQADLSASNGVVHKVDTVLLPAALSQSIFQVASSNLLLSTLTGLIVMADLEGTLAAGIFTVLAPTNAAFAAIPAETLESITSNQALLTRLLLYHVLPGVVPTQLLQDGQLMETALSQGTITVSISGNAVSFGGVPVTRANVVGANGILHLISEVLSLR